MTCVLRCRPVNGVGFFYQSLSGVIIIVTFLGLSWAASWAQWIAWKVSIVVGGCDNICLAIYTQRLYHLSRIFYRSHVGKRCCLAW